MLRRLQVTVELVAASVEGVGENCVKVVVTNVGWWRVTVTFFGLEFMGSKAMAGLAALPQLSSDSPLPVRLARGEAVHRSFALRDVSTRLTQRIGAWTESALYGCCTDAAARVYRSEVWRFTPFN